LSSLDVVLDFKIRFAIAANVACVYLVLVFKILQLADNCCSIKINVQNDILEPALNKHIVVRSLFFLQFQKATIHFNP
jgi:hypothetical protein